MTYGAKDSGWFRSRVGHPDYHVGTDIRGSGCKTRHWVLLILVLLLMALCIYGIILVIGMRP